ncbi:hypothetical protein [Iodobacter fluviatilis]|uniref:Uncharacterized protein n=1 Tax=Iodobacter fluviatilis TaxID=537 RepID=A0A7G3GFU8_9NEIS|nr:hypothetical protein [Iodobacter fluviatilis]QBC45745.1 hypothetical protein C1H71_13550 [Iodobacter fluviatilis]
MSENKGFKFKLSDKVRLKLSGETGEVIGQAAYLTDANGYFVRYKDATGKQVEQWWGESAIELDAA